jgi:hypothetical protein
VEGHRVEDVPAVEAPLGGTVLAFVVQGAADVGGGKNFGKAVAATEVILGAGAGKSGEPGIAIDIELDLAFTEPAVGKLGPGEEGASCLYGCFSRPQ